MCLNYAQDNRGKCGAHFAYKGGSGICVKVCNSFSLRCGGYVEIRQDCNQYQMTEASLSSEEYPTLNA